MFSSTMKTFLLFGLYYSELMEHSKSTTNEPDTQTNFTEINLKIAVAEI